MGMIRKKKKHSNRLGEGMLIKKKNIFLKEEDNNNNGNPTALQSGSPTDVVNQAKKAGGASQISGSDADGTKDGEGEGESLFVSTKDPQAVQKVTQFTSNPQNGNAQIYFNDPTKGSYQQVYVPKGSTKTVTLQGNNESKRKKGKLVEMKKNSISFSKKELRNFLKKL